MIKERKKIVLTILAEYTDTFGGEANYSWVRRVQFDCEDSPSDLSIVRQAKKELGLTGVRCNREQWGEDIVLRPVGEATIVFITVRFE